MLKTMPALTISPDELRSGIEIIAAATQEVLGVPSAPADTPGPQRTEPRGEDDDT
nr:hypothetical protein GCM10025730_03920 [Promicromonospora thailandica]